MDEKAKTTLRRHLTLAGMTTNAGNYSGKEVSLETVGGCKLAIHGRTHHRKDSKSMSHRHICTSVFIIESLVKQTH